MGLRIATFDIETTSLEASYGRLLCACFKFSDERKVRTVRARRYKDEPRALEQVAALWDKADVIVSWNGKLFDARFVNARLMIRRCTPPILDPSKKHLDLLYNSRRLRTRGHRLDGIAKDLQLKRQKYDVEAEAWIKAADGDRESFERIAKHCELDVRITEDALDRLRPYIIRITR